jgi:hypothetical protein
MKTTKPHSQDSQFLNWDLNVAPQKYMSQALSFEPICLTEKSKYVRRKLQEVTEMWDSQIVKTRRMAIFQHHFDKNIKMHSIITDDWLTAVTNYTFLCNINWMLSEEFSITQTKNLDMLYSVTNMYNTITAVVTFN